MVFGKRESFSAAHQSKPEEEGIHLHGIWHTLGLLLRLDGIVVGNSGFKEDPTLPLRGLLHTFYDLFSIEVEVDDSDTRQSEICSLKEPLCIWIYGVCWTMYTYFRKRTRINIWILLSVVNPKGCHVLQKTHYTAAPQRRDKKCRYSNLSGYPSSSSLY